MATRLPERSRRPARKERRVQPAQARRAGVRSRPEGDPAKRGQDGERRVQHVAVVVGLAVAAILAPAHAAHAQGAWWGWGRAPGPTAAWDPARFADYLYSGHEPHPAVARIVAPESSGTALGSGVLVDVNRTQGLVLTNWHVVRDSRSALLVQFADGFQSAGTVVRWDEAWDLAAVVIWRPATTPVAIAAKDPALGERLTIAGFGRGAYREETGPCTDYLSPGTGHAKELVELQATARQGDSGGPIFNERRELAGVLFGQAEGRTIGSCSTRVRTFLAVVGSNGFTPLPSAEFSAGPALDRGVGPAAGPPPRIAAADGPVERATHVAAPPLELGQGMVPVAPGQAPEAPALPPAAGGVAPAAVVAASGADFGPTRPASAPSPLVAVVEAAAAEGGNLLTGAGGAALALVGLRIVLQGRRFTSPADE
jgi:hypothetical protein